jgi:hypothetical protein
MFGCQSFTVKEDSRSCCSISTYTIWGRKFGVGEPLWQMMVWLTQSFGELVEEILCD